MDKRTFLATAAIGAASLPALTAGAADAKSGRGPALLTITGSIGRGNRGPLNVELDAMMHKQKITFDKAHCFDFAALTAMPAIDIKPTLEQDSKPHLLRGPLLLDVIKATGAQVTDATKLVMRAVDAYASVFTVADVRKMRFIVATHLDGQPMALGGLGPLWAVYDADKIPEMAAKPVTDRFNGCPWALYYIEVQTPKA